MNRHPALTLLLPVVAAGCSGGNAADKAVLVSADGKYRVVHVADARWKGDLAKAEMESVLERLPKIDLVYAHNDPMAMGAYLAAKAKGRDGEMKFVGIDALPGLDGGRQAVADGKLAVTFIYPTGGKEAVEIADKIFKGEKVPHKITLPTAMITKENVQEYLAK